MKLLSNSHTNEKLLSAARTALRTAEVLEKEFEDVKIKFPGLALESPMTRFASDYRKTLDGGGLISFLSQSPQIEIRRGLIQEILTDEVVDVISKYEYYSNTEELEQNSLLSENANRLWQDFEYSKKLMQVKPKDLNKFYIDAVWAMLSSVPLRKLVVDENADREKIGAMPYGAAFLLSTRYSAANDFVYSLKKVAENVMRS